MGLLDRFTSDKADSQTPDKYRILVTAGPSYDTSTHQTVPVNGDEAVAIENDFISAKVRVRVRGYRGLPTGSPASSDYFEDSIHEKDQYSVAFSFVPKQDIPSLDTVWGNDFDHPIRDRLPPGFNTAFKIVKEFIDPGLSCDAYADEPWLYGPSLSCWFAFRIGEKDGAFPPPGVLQDGADGSGQDVRQALGIPDSNEKRRKFFLDAKNRKEMSFEKGRLYQADFYNPYLDFGNLALKLPGFSLKVYKYIDNKSHCLRYVFKNRETGDMYLNINFNLLWGQQLEDYLASEKQSGDAKDDLNKAEHDKKAEGTVQEQPQQDDKPAQIEYTTQTQPQQDDMTAQTEYSTQTQPQQNDSPKQQTSAASTTSADVDNISQLLTKTSTDNKQHQQTSILDVD